MKGALTPCSANTPLIVIAGLRFILAMYLRASFLVLPLLSACSTSMRFLSVSPSSTSNRLKVRDDAPVPAVDIVFPNVVAVDSVYERIEPVPCEVVELDMAVRADHSGVIVPVFVIDIDPM